MDPNDIEFRRYLLSMALHNITEYNLEPLNDEVLAMALRTELLEVLMKPNESYEKLPDAYQHLSESELRTIVEINVSIFSDFLAKQIAIRKIYYREEISELINLTLASLCPLWPIC